VRLRVNVGFGWSSLFGCVVLFGGVLLTALIKLLLELAYAKPSTGIRQVVQTPVG
jgi:hypothetical protein